MRPGLPSTLVLSPFSHISGYAQPLLAMLTAGRIVLPTSDDLGEIADLIEAHEVRSIVGASATVLGGLAALAVTRPFHSLGTIGTHGGKEADQAARALSRVLPQACVSITYGMTETSGAIAMRLAGADDAALDRIGFVVPNIDLKIVDPAGEEVQPGISGRILVRGPMLMQGYIHPGEGLERRSPGAWFDTGDIGAFDLGGELSVLGRAVDRGGGDIDEAVAGIEEALRRHPGVLEVIALRSPRPTATRDDMVVALVPSPIGGEPPFADWLRREAGWNAQAPRFVELNSMPRLHSGKIDRRGLRDALFR
jgi:acyl-CoA synthetase (AMP-forming)/AMP-acid ligase II